MLISGTTELAAVQLVLKFLGGVLVRANLMSFSTSSLFFWLLFTVMSNVNRGWNPASQKGAWGKLLERFLKTVVKEPPLAHLQITVALFWKNYELLQILLKCGFRVVHKFFNRTMKSLFFRWDFSVVCLAVVVKLVETVFTTLPFWTLSLTWLSLFGLFKLNSVDDWKKPGKN